MSEDVRDSLIPYDEIVQDALRAVVGRVLSQVVGSDSLPGEHHFYITFKTQAPGVAIPGHLIAKYPDEMTIVLQTRFWYLTVEEESFSVDLSFIQTPSILTIPYAPITPFAYTSGVLGLQFTMGDDVEAPEQHNTAENDRAAVCA